MSEFIAFRAANWARRKGRETFSLPSCIATHCGAQVALRSTIPNALLKRDLKASVLITHPAHPLKGQILTILPMVGGKLESKQLLVALPNGEQQLIPTEWTDQTDPPHSLPGALFLFERLVILRQRLDSLLEVKPAILSTSEQVLDQCGGSHVDRQSSNPLESDEPRTAGQDHRHPGRDAPPSTEPGDGGAA
jgi:hypothetical protein